MNTKRLNQTEFRKDRDFPSLSLSVSRLIIVSVSLHNNIHLVLVKDLLQALAQDWRVKGAVARLRMIIMREGGRQVTSMQEESACVHAKRRPYMLDAIQGTVKADNHPRSRLAIDGGQVLLERHTGVEH